MSNVVFKLTEEEFLKNEKIEFNDLKVGDMVTVRDISIGGREYYEVLKVIKKELRRGDYNYISLEYLNGYSRSGVVFDNYVADIRTFDKDKEYELMNYNVPNFDNLRKLLELLQFIIAENVWVDMSKHKLTTMGDDELYLSLDEGYLLTEIGILDLKENRSKRGIYANYTKWSKTFFDLSNGDWDYLFNYKHLINKSPKEALDSFTKRLSCLIDKSNRLFKGDGSFSKNSNYKYEY